MQDNGPRYTVTPKPTSAATFDEPHGSVSASDVQKILDRTDWQKYWSDVNEAASKEIEAYEKAEARSKRTNRFIR